MKILQIRPLTPSTMTATFTGAITDPSIYAATTAYAIGDKCVFGNNKYQCILAATGKQPDSNATYWQYIGMINKYAMIDEYLNTQSLAAGDITITFDTAGENGIYLTNMLATTLTVTQVANGNTVMSKTVQLVNTVSDFYTYNFDPIDYRADYFVPLALYYNSTVTITLNHTNAKIGGIFIGKISDVGSSLWDTEVGIIDYSKKTTDSFGNTYLKQGYFKKRLRLNYAVQTAKIDYLMRVLAQVRGTAVVFIASDMYDSLMAYGFFTDITQTYNNPTMSFGNISIEGLI